MIITPEQFGAKADGISNDAYAFWKSIDSLNDGDMLQLKANSKYYIAPYENNGEYSFETSGMAKAENNRRICAIDLKNIENVTIKGNNTTILLEKPLFYCNINYTKGVKLEGLIFDYRERPFAKAELIKLNKSNNSAVMQFDRSIRINKAENVYGFGVLQRPDGRYHMNMNYIEPINEEKFIYNIQFDDDDTTVSRLDMLKTNVLIAPVPNFAHQIERAFSITYNTDFSMTDCKIYSIARFGFALFRNDGIIIFDNLQVKKAPDESVDIVSWRDCFHVKENHAKFIWKNCYAEYCYDDIFNISASTLNVLKVFEEDELDLEWRETNSVYEGARVGDTFSFFDYESGSDLGQAVLKEIVYQGENHNHFKFDRPIKGITPGINSIVHDNNMVAAGSEILNCDFRGTFRFRGPIEIKNTKFYVARMWIDWYPPFEGPIPKSIHFENCKITCDDEVNPYFHILSQKLSNKAKNKYHVEDIKFINCELPIKTFEIDDLDKPYVEFI